MIICCIEIFFFAASMTKAFNEKQKSRIVAALLFYHSIMHSMKIIFLAYHQHTRSHKFNLCFWLFYFFNIFFAFACIFCIVL